MKALSEMRVGIHTDFMRGANKAIEEGAKALGMQAVYRAVNVYHQGETEAFDLVVCGSMHGKNTVIASDYEAKGVPVLVHDLSRARRDLQQVYLGRGGLQWMPKGPMPADRAERLGLTAATRKKGAGKFNLLLGQMPGDKAHGLDDKSLAATYAKIVAMVKAQSDLPVAFRPHPNHTNIQVPGVDEVRDPSLESLDEVLADAAAAFTLSSTSGVRAVEMGVPLYCSPSAFYAGVADGHVAGDQIIQLSGGDKEQFLKDLAYTQWSLRELANGTALRFMLIELGLVDESQLPEVEDQANDHTGVEDQGGKPEEEPGASPEGAAADADPEHHKSLIGSSIQPAEFHLTDGTTVPLGDVVAKAHKESGLSIDAWNDQQDEEREARIKAVVDAMDLPNPGESVDAAAAAGDAAPETPAENAEAPAAEVGEAGAEKPAEEPAGEAAPQAKEEKEPDEHKPGKPKGGKGGKKAAK